MSLETSPNPMTNPLREQVRDTRVHRRPRVGTGIFLILLGLVLASNQWQELPFHHFSRQWPLILIAFGIGRMVDRGFFATGPHAAILVGLYFELEVLGHYDWIQHTWPLGFVWIGLIIVLRALHPRPATSCEWSHE